MLFKRFLTIATLSVLLLTSFAACSKKENNEQENESTPTIAISGDETPTTTPVPDVITIGGAFARENAYLSFGIVESSWTVSGYFFPEEEGAEPLVLSGTAEFEGKAELSYTDDNNSLTFVFAADSVTATVNKGTDYAAFAGTYARIETDSSEIILTPEKDSEAEILGRIALTHYMVNAENTEGSVDITALKFDSKYMEAFLLAYADLFLVDKADFLPEVSDKYLCYTYTKDALDDLLLTVTAGAFDTAQLNITDSGIVSKDGNYYIPCQGKIAGGLTVSSENQNAASGSISLGGVVAKPDGTRYDLTLTLSTKENSAAGSIGVQITSVDCKFVK